MKKWQRAAVASAVVVAGLTGAGAWANAQTAIASGERANVKANEREVRSFLRDVIDKHHGDQAGRFLTTNMEWHGGTVGTVKGRADVAGLFASVVVALPDVHATIKDIFGQGNQVVVRVVVRGTQKGAILGIPATGRDIHWDGVDIYQLQGGKIRAIWAGDDWSAILFYTGTYKAPWIH